MNDDSDPEVGLETYVEPRAPVNRRRRYFMNIQFLELIFLSIILTVSIYLFIVYINSNAVVINEEEGMSHTGTPDSINQAEIEDMENSHGGMADQLPLYKPVILSDDEGYGDDEDSFEREVERAFDEDDDVVTDSTVPPQSLEDLSEFERDNDFVFERDSDFVFEGDNDIVFPKTLAKVMKNTFRTRKFNIPRRRGEMIRSF